MSFIGLVTRKEKDTGVTLVAKIVTPNKKKSAKKAFKVKVKANALDDYSCCVIDHATVKSRLENSQDLTGMIEDIVLSYNGANGTSIRYEINDKPNAYPRLSDFLTEDGKLLGRPKYSPTASGDAEGTLTIIVTKGNAEVRSNLQIAVKGITAEEVFAQGAFSKQKIWQTICGSNKPDYSEAYHMGGNNNITYPLVFVNEIRCDDISTVPVKLTYTITDSLGAFIPANGEINGNKNAFKDENGEVVKCRISNDGKVFTLPFSVAAYMCNSTAIQGSKITDESMISDRRVRIGGIEISVSMSLSDSLQPRVLKLDCSVMSKKLTNEEIYTYIIDKYFKYFYNDNQMEFNDDSVVPLAPSPVNGNNTCTLKFMSANVCTTFESADLGIKAGDLRSGISFEYGIRTAASGLYDPSDAQKAFANYADFNGKITDESTYYIPLVVDFNNMKTMSVDKHEFCIQCEITVNGFTVNGETSFGQPTQSSKLAKFKCNMSAVATGGSSSGSGNE